MFTVKKWNRHTWKLDTTETIDVHYQDKKPTTISLGFNHIDLYKKPISKTVSVLYNPLKK